MPPRVAWISIAPVKGLALQHRESVRLEPFGVRENRRFHLIGEDGRLLNGKQLAPLVRISADWDEGNGRLALGFPDGNVLEGEVELGDTVSTSFYGHRHVEGRLVVGPWSDALSEFVGQPVRLVQPTAVGAGNDRAGGGVSILSTGSLEAIREAAGISRTSRSPPLPDALRRRGRRGPRGGRMGRVTACRSARPRSRCVGNVGRCLVTSRHPDSGARNLPTLDVLAEYRGDLETTERLPFGVWGGVTKPGVVHLGDPVRV